MRRLNRRTWLQLSNVRKHESFYSAFWRDEAIFILCILYAMHLPASAPVQFNNSKEGGMVCD